MIKRYDTAYYGSMHRDDTGDYVLYKDVEKLKEINLLLLSALKEIEKYSFLEAREENILLHAIEIADRSDVWNG